jgi:hypothetical protein
VLAYVCKPLGIGECGDRRKILVDFHDLLPEDRYIVASTDHDASAIVNPDRFRSVSRLSDRHWR